MLFCLSVQFAGGVQYIIQVATGKLSVMIILVIFLYVEVNGTLTDVCISVLQDFFHQFYLLDDMS